MIFGLKLGYSFIIWRRKVCALLQRLKRRWAVGGPWQQVRSQLSENFYSRQRWLASLGLAGPVAAAYFLAARLRLLLLSKPDGVPVFWPAAGVASGILIAIGPSARWPVAAGTMVATALANLLGDRNFELAAISALCKFCPRQRTSNIRTSCGYSGERNSFWNRWNRRIHVVPQRCDARFNSMATLVCILTYSAWWRLRPC